MSTDKDVTRPLRVAMIGHAFMGRMHTQAWKTAGRFFDLDRPVECAVLVGHDPERAAAAAHQLEWAESSHDWRATIARDDIDIVDICTPGDSHAEIALAALAAGKHVLCEKPLANSVADAEEMTAAAERAAGNGQISMCGFSYRRVPAITHARDLVASGRLGEIRQIRGRYLQDWLSDPQIPWSWRLDKQQAGSGALGDIGAHILDLAEYVTGLQIAEISGTLQTFVHERPKVASASLGARIDDGTEAEMAPVTVDDAMVAMARFVAADGTVQTTTGSFEATRFATGRKNAIQLEISGSLGAIHFDFEDLNSLYFYDATASSTEQGFARILTSQADHPWTGNWWPVGHGLGYEHSFTHQVVDLLAGIASGEQPRPSFADALHIQRVLAAVETSAADDSRWASV